MIKNVVTSQNIRNNAKLQKQSNWTSKRANMMSYVANIQNYAKLRKWSNYNELHRFDVKTIKATQNSKRYQITMNLHRFDVQTIKMLSYVANHSKQRKTTKAIKLDVKTSKNDELRRKHSKLRKTTKVIKIQWLASIWCQKWSSNDEFAPIWRQNELKCWVTSQNILNNAKLQKWSNYNELHRFDIKTNKNVALGRQPFKTTQNYKSDQNTMTCIDLMSKMIK